MIFQRNEKTGNNIRRIADLFGRKDKIYIYLANRDIGNQFLKDAEKEGFHFGDEISPTEREPDEVMAIHTDRTICYLGCVGHLFFYQKKCKIPRIDYERYINGERRYMFRSFKMPSGHNKTHRCAE